MMIEQKIINRIVTHNMRAYAEMPPTPPALPFYIVEKTGGGESETISRALIAVQSYGSSLFNAATANEEVIEIVKGLIDDPQVCSIELDSDYNFTDPAKKEYRYQAVFEIYYYR